RADLNPARWRIDSARVLVALIWGATFVLVKEALADVSTLLFFTLRLTVWGIALVLLLNSQIRRDMRQPVVLRRSIGAGMLAGLCLFAGYAFQTFGLKYTTPAKAGFLTG